MVDFVKVICRDVGFLRDHEYLETLFKREVNLSTGETKNFESATLQNLKFKLYDSGLLELSGSLHKYWNNGQHNANDFSFSSLLNVLNELKREFGIDLDQCMIQNIEFGLNIRPPVPSNEILESLVVHKAKGFDRRFNGLMKEASYSQYICKYYDKGKQEKLSHECFRYELKYIRSCQLTAFGIKNLADLQQSGWPKLVENELLKHWQNTLLYEPTYSQTPKYEWQIPCYWSKLPATTRLRQKQQFKRVMETHSENLKDQLETLLLGKWKELKKKVIVINSHLG